MTWSVSLRVYVKQESKFLATCHRQLDGNKSCSKETVCTAPTMLALMSEVGHEFASSDEVIHVRSVPGITASASTPGIGITSDIVRFWQRCLKRNLLFNLLIGIDVRSPQCHIFVFDGVRWGQR